ncbi:MAG TPA: hypothetical protein VKW78_12010 [Terriglobales bacterium]|nr:hypothetical protein [Terriglobales bacterium]
MRRRTLVVLLFCGVYGLHAQTVDEIVAKALQARGGVSAIKAIQSERLTGHISFEKNSPAGFMVQIKRPEKMREEIDFSEKTMIETTDGSTGWRLMATNGTGTPEQLTPGEVQNMEGGADIDGPLLDYRRKGNKVELVGKAKVGNEDAYKLKVIDKKGEVRYDYLDANSFLEIKWEGQVENAGKTNTFASLFSDYRKVQGVMFAFAITSGTADNPNAQKIVFDKVEVNVPMSDTLFGKPSPPTRAGQPAH